MVKGINAVYLHPLGAHLARVSTWSRLVKRRNIAIRRGEKRRKLSHFLFFTFHIQCPTRLTRRVQIDSNSSIVASHKQSAWISHDMYLIYAIAIKYPHSITQ